MHSVVHVNLHCRVASSHLRSEEHTSELQSQFHIVCRLLLEKKKAAGDGNRQRAFLGGGGAAIILAADQARISRGGPATAEDRITGNAGGCQGEVAAPDRGEQFAAAISEAQPVFFRGRSGEGRLQGFGARGFGPRRCSRAPRKFRHYSHGGTFLDQTSSTFAEGKAVGYAAGRRAAARAAARPGAARFGWPGRRFTLTTRDS